MAKVKLIVPVILDRLPSEEDLSHMAAIEGVYVMRQFKAVAEFIDKGYIEVTMKNSGVFSDKFKFFFNDGEYEEL